MSHYPQTLVRLIRELSKLPGIGEKTAERLAMHILKGKEKDARDLAEAIVAAKSRMGICSVCFGLSDSETCSVCSDPGRDAGLVCVVEQASDMVALEKSGAFKGAYHVLQGTLSPMDNVGPENIRIAELLRRVAAGGIREVLLATSPSAEGESTATYIGHALSAYPITVSRIAMGIPVGGDIKYTDALTLKLAVDGRRKM
ncbi:MAG: recombination mediator RecR [Thermodesulfobacteriota bacterium]